ncbi:MAG: hypothetical protein COB67_00125 [SAR324 cluster bacterium]|uniref:Uncharacterized protein n=1 Tax=SAR324 cluster bacterium TaxID=2024889 RepID=A0A2A4TCP5_9DELT|nr:MAG: hypothetical protein COB67_00125 [SAR324 cluster bacterium]
MPNSKKLRGRELRVDRAFAQADITYKKKEVIQIVNGNRVVQKVNVATPNQERINDAITMHFQEAARKGIDYFKIEESVISELEETFIKHNLLNNNPTTDERRLKNACIRQRIDERIIKHFDDPKIEMTYDELIDFSGIKSGKNFAQTISTIMSVKGKSSKEFKRDIVNFETMSIDNTTYKSVVDISEVEVILDPEMAQHYPLIEDFLNAKKMPDGRAFRNKKKYIKRIVFTLTKSVLPHIVAQGRDYVALLPHNRQAYKLQITYHIDTYITSIQNAQEYRSLTDFTPAALQKKFGYDWDEFYEFMRQVMEPGIKDFNTNDRRTVSYLVQRGTTEWKDPKSTTRGASPITKFRWVITGYENTKRDEVDGSLYYIAQQLLNNELEYTESDKTVIEVAQDIASQIETELPDMTILFGVSVTEWLKRAQEELEYEEKVLQLLKISDVNDILYDEELMVLVSDKINLSSLKNPSDSYEYLFKLLKIEITEVKTPKKKNETFPINNKVFILNVLKSAHEHDFSNPIHFFYTIYNYYKSNGTKKHDWNSVINNWLINGKYDKTKETSIKLAVTPQKDTSTRHIGFWSASQEVLETETEIISISFELMAELIADGNVKIYGAL